MFLQERGRRRTWGKAYHSPRSNAEAENKWSYTSPPPPIRIQGAHVDKVYVKNVTLQTDTGWSHDSYTTQKISSKIRGSNLKQVISILSLKFSQGCWWRLKLPGMLTFQDNHIIPKSQPITILFLHHSSVYRWPLQHETSLRNLWANQIAVRTLIA